MANNLALEILIKAKDQASSVFNNIKNSISGFAGAAVAAFSVGFLRASITDAEKLDAQLRKLEATIKATGGAAGLTAGDIAKMFGGDDNAVEFRDAAVQLLTFKSVSKDVFETTLRLADDLAEAGFGSLSSNAVQLGKALEDPVNGLAALTRSGVTFTESQKELISQLVETGDKAKAQGLILDAVAGQVGGVADAVGSGLRGANESIDASFRRIRENVGGALTPALSVLADGIAKVTDRWASLTTSTDAAGNSVKKYSDSAIVLAKITGGLGLAFDVAGRYLGAYAAAAASILSGDFGSANTIFKDYLSDNAEALDDFNNKIDELAKPRVVDVKTNIDTGSVQNATAAIDTDVQTVINKFKIWDQESTDSINNIAAELQKLSDVELQNMQNSLATAFETGVDRSQELQAAIDAIQTEEVTRAWKTLGQESSASLKQASDAARAAYVTIRDSGQASAKDLENAWSAYINKVLQAKTAISEVDATEKQRQQNLADLDAIGATAAQKSELRRRELTQQTIDFEKAKNEGRLADAVQIAREREQLALDNAKAEKQAFVDGEQSSGDAYLARLRYLKSVEDTKKAVDSLKQSEQAQTQNPDQKQQPDNLPNSLDTQQQLLEKMQASLEKVSQPVTITINGNLAEAGAQLDEILKKLDAAGGKFAAINSSAANANNIITDNTAQTLSIEALKRGSRY